MKQVMMLTFSVDKETPVAAVADWLQTKMAASAAAKLQFTDPDLIFCGELATYLSRMTIHSAEEIAPAAMRQIFAKPPHFIHQLEFRPKR